MTDLAKPHDKFIKELLSDRETVKEFLSHYPPAEMIHELDLDHLAPLKDSFIDQKLHEFFSDMLYQVSLARDQGFVYILFEHKSYDAPLTILQILEYQIKIWRFFRKQYKKELFPVIIPILVYHGDTPWKHGTRLSDLMHIPTSLLTPYIPDFSFILCDLTSMPDSEIKGSFLLKLSLLLIKYVQQPDFAENLRRIFHSFRDQGLRKLDESQWLFIIRYILNATGKISLSELHNVIEENLASDTGGMMTSLAEQLKKEGELIGELKKTRHNIVQILTIRFNKIPSSIKNGLQEITKERVLDNLLKSAVKVEAIDQFTIALNLELSKLNASTQKSKRRSTDRNRE